MCIGGVRFKFDRFPIHFASFFKPFGQTQETTEPKQRFRLARIAAE